MRKLICILTAVLMCAALICPALAAEDFVPSISYKGVPRLVTIKDRNGNNAFAVVRNAAGEIVDYMYESCMLLTPVARAADDQDISAGDKAELLEVYDALSNGTMKLPYGEGVDAEDMVIRDLFHIGWLCDHDHDAALLPEGVVIELIFDLGVDADETVVVMTYKNDAWGEIAKVVNNGDGTVTCTFEHLCPVAIAVESETAGEPGDGGDAFGGTMYLWIVLMVVSAAAVVVVATSRRKVQ